MTSGIERVHRGCPFDLEVYEDMLTFDAHEDELEENDNDGEMVVDK